MSQKQADSAQTNSLEAIGISEEIRKMATSYRSAVDGKTIKHLKDTYEEAKSMFWVCLPIALIAGLLSALTFHFMDWSSEQNLTDFSILILGSVFAAISFFFGVGLFHSIFDYPVSAVRYKRVAHLERTAAEEEIFLSKLHKLADKVTEAADAVNSGIQELDLHRRMKKLNMGAVDHERAERILKAARLATLDERERLETLLELKDRRDQKALDLSGALRVLGDASSDALAEVQADLEVEPEEVLSTLSTTLAIDALDAELGDPKAIERERDARKKNQAGAVRAQAV